MRFLSTWIFFSKVFQKSDCYWVLGASLHCFHAKQIRDPDELE